MSDKLKTYLFALCLCLVVSILLTVTANGLKKIQEKNVALDRQKNILLAVDLIPDTGKVKEERIANLYQENIRSVWVSPDGLIRKKDEQAPGDMHICLYEKDGKIKAYIIPINTQGLWGNIHGYLALENDGKTVMGFTVYKHQETPGLGGEIEKAWFRNNFKGKKIVNRSGEFVSVGVAKGEVENLPEPKKAHYVDGISGATLTGKYLTQGLASVLSEYEPVSVRFRQDKPIYPQAYPE